MLKRAHKSFVRAVRRSHRQDLMRFQRALIHKISGKATKVRSPFLRQLPLPAHMDSSRLLHFHSTARKLWFSHLKEDATIDASFHNPDIPEDIRLRFIQNLVEKILTTHDLESYEILVTLMPESNQGLARLLIELYVSSSHQWNQSDCQFTEEEKEAVQLIQDQLNAVDEEDQLYMVCQILMDLTSMDIQKTATKLTEFKEYQSLVRATAGMTRYKPSLIQAAWGFIDRASFALFSLRGFRKVNKETFEELDLSVEDKIIYLSRINLSQALSLFYDNQSDVNYNAELRNVALKGLSSKDSLDFWRASYIVSRRIKDTQVIPILEKIVRDSKSSSEKYKDAQMALLHLYLADADSRLTRFLQSHDPQQQILCLNFVSDNLIKLEQKKVNVSSYLAQWLKSDDPKVFEKACELFKKRFSDDTALFNIVNSRMSSSKRAIRACANKTLKQIEENQG